jgi:hypothetical protein
MGVEKGDTTYKSVMLQGGNQKQPGLVEELCSQENGSLFLFSFLTKLARIFQPTPVSSLCEYQTNNYACLSVNELLAGSIFNTPGYGICCAWMSSALAALKLHNLYFSSHLLLD